MSCTTNQCYSRDMSIVGPRPERPFFVDQFNQENPNYYLRHNVRGDYWLCPSLWEVCF